MTRWLSGVILLALGVLTTVGQAQGPYPQPGFQNTGYLGASPQPYSGSWPTRPNGPPVGGGLHAQLVPGQGGGWLSPGTRLGSLITRTPNQSWVRFDYLNWTIKGADRTLVGAPVALQADGTPIDLSGVDRANRLIAVDRSGASPRLNTFGVVPRIGQSEENGLNGFRGTVGVPTTAGTFEANAFVLEEFDQTITINPFVDMFNFTSNTLIGAVTLLENGVAVDDTMILFSEGMRTSFSTNIYGVEANWIKPPFTPNVGLTVQPILGVRYINFRDRLSVTGSDIPDPINAPTVILNHQISSFSQNHIVGPQVGFRAETRRNKLTIGTDLKFIFGINQISTQVKTAQIFSVTELPRTVTDDRIRFAPVVDFSVNGKYQIRDNISVLVSYQLIAGGSFSRAFDNIDYNASSAVNDPPLIGTRNRTSSFYAHGLTLGMEILLP